LQLSASFAFLLQNLNIFCTFLAMEYFAADALHNQCSKSEAAKLAQGKQSVLQPFNNSSSNIKTKTNICQTQALTPIEYPLFNQYFCI
jgi:hypothetical protein